MSSEEQYEFAVSQKNIPDGRYVEAEIAIIVSIDETGQRLYTYKFGPTINCNQAIGILENVKLLIFADMMGHTH